MKKFTYLNATGPIEFNMTNDYMFRVILQENETVLRSLICSLLHLKSDDILSVKITNPIILGANIDEKEFVLDVNVLMNDNTVINLEMQMENEGNWSDRSLCYLCRNFTHIQKGHDYTEAKPVIHIGFLDYQLFPEIEEFYSTYQLLNIKNHHLFSSKLTIGVVYLNQTNLATQDDKAYELDKWITLFKSKTWEELKMIAKENPQLAEATESLYHYNNEDTIRFQCYAREDYRKKMNTIRRDKEMYEARLAEQENTISAQENTISAQENTISMQESTISMQEQRIAELEALLAEKNH